MKIIYTILFLLCMYLMLANTALGQDSLFRLDKTIKYPIESFTVNNLGEIYIINSSNQLKKLDDKGDSVGVFNMVNKYGRLSYIEAQNPWRTILFYKNFSIIVLLDKYLNMLANINLRQQNFFNVKAVTASYDNNIWLFDEQDSKLKKIDNSGKSLLETIDLRLLFDSVPSPEQIIDKGGFVYLYDPKKGMYVFDYYGAFKNKITFLSWKDFTVIGKTIYGYDDKYFYTYSINSLDLKQYALPAALNNYKSLKVGNNKLYLLKNNALDIYSLP
jgi:hypothetical protein